MFIKPVDTETIGYEIVHFTLRAAALSLESGKPYLQHLIEVPFQEDSAPDVNPLYISDEAKQFRSLIEKRLSAAGLSAHQVLVRRLPIKLMKEKDVDAAFSFQAEPMLPFPLASAVIDKMTLFKAEGMTHLTLLAARKDQLKSHLEKWSSLDIEPEVVSAVPVALAAFAQIFIPFEETICLVHVDAESLVCTYVKNGKILASFGQSHGLKDVSENNVQALELDIRRTVLALKKELRLKDDVPLCFTGEGALVSSLPSRIGKALNVPVTPIEIPTGFKSHSEQELLKFAVPIGLALNCLSTSSDPINFRQEEHSYGSPWKRFMKPLAFFAACCLLLASSFYIFGQSYLSYKLDQARENYIDLLSSLQKSYNLVEMEYASKQSGVKVPSEEEIVPVNQLTREQILSRLEFIQKQLQSLPDTYALYPNIPLVSDFLAWLSTHPKVKCSLEDKKELGTDACKGIEIETFSYTMAKRPDQTKKGEKYQVKIDMEFTAATPTQAREFHDALIAPNDMIDTKGEVKWSSNRGKYRASFFLKDKIPSLQAMKAEEKSHA